MKKRIFSFLTALCLCLTLLPTAARAENNWESWTIFDGTNLNLSDGSYYLGGNVTMSGEITISGAVTFDLNGYTLTCNGASGDTAFFKKHSNINGFRTPEQRNYLYSALLKPSISAAIARFISR